MHVETLQVGDNVILPGSICYLGWEEGMKGKKSLFLHMMNGDVLEYDGKPEEILYWFRRSSKVDA